VGSEGYPPDLETLVTASMLPGKKLKFLRKIPIDPMTGQAEWGMRSMQDDATSELLGRPERLRRLQQVAGHSSGRLEIQGLVDDTSAPGRACAAVSTLIEMVVVISLILVMCSIALPMYNQSILRAKESTLRQDLFTLRHVIQQYTLDKQKAPQALEIWSRLTI